MKFGVFTVMLPDLAPEEAAREIKAAGYAGVEWRVTTIPPERRKEPPSFWGNNYCTLEPTPEAARRARSLAAANGLALPNIGSYAAMNDIPATIAAMRFAQLAGAPLVRVGFGSMGEGSYGERFALAVRYLAEVERLAREHRVKAIVEMHHRTICASASLAHRLVSRFAPEYIGVLYDPGNMVYEGFEDYGIGLELLGPYLAHVHIKNAAYQRPEGGGVWRPCWAPLEDGVVDFPAFLRALRSVGYDGWLVFEDFSQARPSREALRFNLRFIQDVLAQSE